MIYAGGLIGFVFISITYRLYAGVFAYHKLGHIHCELDKPRYHVGDEIHYTIQICPPENVTLNSIQVFWLKCEEVAYRDPEKGKRSYYYNDIVGRETPCQSVNISAGENFIVSGKFVLPDAMHTFKAIDNCIIWSMNITIEIAHSPNREWSESFEVLP